MAAVDFSFGLRTVLFFNTISGSPYAGKAVAAKK
jgi:hypothetical protein